MSERCQFMAANPPPRDWNGTFGDEGEVVR